MLGRQRPYGREPLRECVGDLARVTAGPDPRAVDAAPAAVDEHAVDHHVEVLLPPIDLVVAKQDLRKAGAMCLHAGIPAIPIDRRLAAEDEAAREVLEDRGAAIRLSWIYRDGFARNT